MTGVLYLIARTVDASDAQRNVIGLTLLSNVLCSPAQIRSFTKGGHLFDRSTLSDGSEHIVSVVLR